MLRNSMIKEKHISLEIEKENFFKNYEDFKSWIWELYDQSTEIINKIKQFFFEREFFILIESPKDSINQKENNY